MIKHGNWVFPWPDYGKAHFDGQDGPQLEKLETALGYVTNWNHAIDGGAHIGSYTCQLCRRFSRVTAFEPVLEVAACIAININNRISDLKSVPTVHTEALGDKMSRCRMYMPKSGKTEELMSMSTYAKETDLGVIPIIPLDIFKFSDVGFIKFDLEGFDAKAIEGAEETIRKNKPVMLIEWKEIGTRNKEQDNKPAWTQDFSKAESILADAGLRLVAEVGADRIYAP